MKRTKIIMGMPVTVEVADKKPAAGIIAEVFSYFKEVDQRFSTYKKNSEISMINRQQLNLKHASRQMQQVFKAANQLKEKTNGFFDIYHNGTYDPSGFVKGWAILNAAKLLKSAGFSNFYIDAGGDIQVAGKNSRGEKWRVGIKNPFNQSEVVKVILADNIGIATSGTYIRGKHIYNPKTGELADQMVSLTVIGPDIEKADAFATAAFAMGQKKGIEFIGNLDGFEGYMIDKNGIATYTGGFENYIQK